MMPLSDSDSWPLRRELWRKAVHLIAAVFPIAYAVNAPRSALTFILAVLSVIALSIELARGHSERARQAFTRVTGPLLRAHEHHRLSGATWLVLALLGAVVLLPRDVAIAAMWAVAAGDAVAALLGQMFGRRRSSMSGKSLEGSIACLLAVFGGSFVIAHLSLAESIVSAVTSAGAELMTRPLDDNVRIVIVAGSAILLWRIAFS